MRADIQAMRGLAVLLVLLFHSGLGICPAGYLGVDMFFVISGFLITGIVAREIRQNNFYFAEFYSRRVRRLLPAAYTMLAVTTLGAASLLTTLQFRDFIINVLGSLSFTANFTLWSQTGYFAQDSAFSPLLHMWSLAIEEQYYLLLPVILFATRPRFWLACLVTGSVISLAGGLYIGMLKPSVAFFWLPARAWELGVGSIAALVWQRGPVRRIARTVLIPGLAALLIVPFVALRGPIPGIGALAVCFGAVVVILAHYDLTRFALVRLLGKVGNFSYSLYLTHWPLFALVRATRLSTDLPKSLAVVLIVVSIALAILLYKFVEEPSRHAPIGGFKLVGAVFAGSLAVIGLAFALSQIKPTAPGSSQLNHPVRGLDQPSCFSDEIFKYEGQCSQSLAPQMLLWGDSYSAHLVPGLVATARHPFAQASKGHCSPFANYAAVATANEFEWTKGCLAFNSSVMNFIRRTSSVKVVILAGQDSRTLSGSAEYAIRTARDGSFVRARLGLSPTIAEKGSTVGLLRAMGKRVVLIAPPPPSPFDLGTCWQRMAEGLPVAGTNRGCTFWAVNEARSAQAFDALIRGFEQRANVPVVRLEVALCRNGRCQIEVDGKPLFRDTGHFTEWGSQVVGRRLNLGELVWQVAK